MAAGYFVLWVMRTDRAVKANQQGIQELRESGVQKITLRWLDKDGEKQLVTITKLPNETVEEWLSRAAETVERMQKYGR